MSSSPISRRLAFALVLAPVAAFTAWMELGPRAYWFKHFGPGSVIAGSAPNAVAVVLLASIFAVAKGRARDATPFRLAVISTLSMVAYEIAQIWMPGRTFDPFDLIASLIGGVIAFLLLVIPYRLTALPGGEAAHR